MSKIDALTKTLYGVENVAVIHSTHEKAPHTVAFVEVEATLPVKEKLEIAFVKTNSIADVWWRNEGVTALFGGKYCRSTMTGDMVLIGTTKYKCDHSGWSNV